MIASRETGYIRSLKLQEMFSYEMEMAVVWIYCPEN